MRKSILYIVLFVLGIIAYFPSFSGTLFWDDTDFIVENQYVINQQFHKFFVTQAVEGSNKDSNYFRPLQFSIYSIIFAISGSNPLLYHAVTIILHIFAACAVYISIKQLPLYFAYKNSSFNIKYSNLLALAVCLLFLVHPVQTEAVSYVSGMSDPLVALFGLLSCYFFMKTPHTKMPIGSIGLYILALLSKESGVVFGGVITLLWILKTIQSSNSWNTSLITKGFKHLSGFWMLTLTYLIYHFQFIQQLDMTSVWGNHPYTHSLILRVITFLSLLPTYILVLLFPKDLFYDRDFSVTIPQNIWHFPSFMIVVFLLILLTLLFLEKKKDTSWYIRIFFFLGFFISFAPFSGLLLINGIMYEHFLYIPMVYFFGFVITNIFKYIYPYYNHSHTKTIAYLIFISIIFILMIRSYSRQFDWQDPIRFYTQTLQYVPHSFRVRNNLAMEYQQRGEVEKAIHEYNQVITLNPTLANPYHNLGNLYLNRQQYQQAEEFFLKALEANPSFYFSIEALIKLYQHTGDVTKLKNLLQHIESSTPSAIYK